MTKITNYEQFEASNWEGKVFWVAMKLGLPDSVDTYDPKTSITLDVYIHIDYSTPEGIREIKEELYRQRRLDILEHKDIINAAAKALLGGK